MSNKLASRNQAIHEAGHAVMLHYLRVPISDVRIFPAETCQPEEGRTTSDSTVVSALKDEEHALIILAGYVADCRAADRPVELSDSWAQNRYGSDRTKLNRVLCRIMDRIPASDYDEDDDTVVDRPVEGLLSSTKAIVSEPSFWEAVIALATELKK